LHCCTSDLIDRLLESLKHGAYGQFLSSLLAYRVFLIDNIWILRYRVYTARKIFSIFRTLIHHGGAVVIASDLEPSVISSWSEEIGDMIGRSRILEIENRGTEPHLTAPILPPSQKR
jgi:chromosomal replication initiation ATPase DnaA